MNIINLSYEESSIESSIVKLQQINEDYEKVRKQVKNIIDENLDNEKYRDKLLQDVDYRVVGQLFEQSTTFFEESHNLARYQIKNKECIQDKIIKENYKFDKKKLKKILETYSEELEEEEQYLNIKSIGTTLNTLREFYSDLDASLLRIQLKQVGKISKSDRYEQYVYAVGKVNNESNENKYNLNLDCLKFIEYNFSEGKNRNDKG